MTCCCVVYSGSVRQYEGRLSYSQSRILTSDAENCVSAPQGMCPGNQVIRHCSRAPPSYPSSEKLFFFSMGGASSENDIPVVMMVSQTDYLKLTKINFADQSKTYPWIYNDICVDDMPMVFYPYQMIWKHLTMKC
jgi:hypothetical protein